MLKKIPLQQKKNNVSQRAMADVPVQMTFKTRRWMKMRRIVCLSMPYSIVNWVWFEAQNTKLQGVERIDRYESFKGYR